MQWGQSPPICLKTSVFQWGLSPNFPVFSWEGRRGICRLYQGMPRTARFVIPGIPHHITQRSNREERVFDSPEDRSEYLRVLRRYSVMYSMEIWAYCLMSNHIHIIGLGISKFAFARAIGVTQMVHAQRMNRSRETSGHVWASRFYSVALSQEHLWNAVRYVELNPVRAGLVERAEDYPWSSAKAHCRGDVDPILCPQRPFPGPVSNWASWLGTGLDQTIENEIRSSTYSSKPNSLFV